MNLKYLLLCGLRGSDEEAKAEEQASVDAHVSEHVCLLLECGQCGLMHDTPVLVVIVDEVACAGLDQQVHLVAHKVATEPLHREVGPVRTFDPVLVLVVLNDSEAVAKGCCVQQGVQGVPGDGEET